MNVPLLRLIPGEVMIWDVQMGGFTIGRAELDIVENRVRSRFTTARIVSSFAKVRHELTTMLDPHGTRPVHANDMLDVDGERTHVESTFDGSRVEASGSSTAVPGGNFGHTLHSALGLLRAWAKPEAHAGYLYIAHAGELFRLEIAQPFVEKLQDTPTLRIECRVRATAKIPAIGMTIWLRETDRTPLRIEVRSEDVKLTAQLVEA